MSNEPWYGAQCIFLHAKTKHGTKQMYEERIILLKADSFDDAIEWAEEEAKEYCRDLDGCKYVGYINVFHIYDAKIDDGTEIFSSMQRSDLMPKEYLDQHYPEGPEDCDAVGETHRWHKLDNKRSTCYHCKVVREGQLWKVKKRRAS